MSIILLFTWLFSASLHSPSVTATISGTITTSDSSVLFVSIVLKQDGKITASSPSAPDGKYSVDLTLEHNIKCVDVFLTGIGIDTLYIASYYPSFTEGYRLDIRLPLEHTKKGGKVICPKCTRGKDVFPIVYGGDPKTVEIIPGKDTIYSPVVHGKYYAGTCIRSAFSPGWYCDRDKIKF